jgi:hypothetical protein
VILVHILDQGKALCRFHDGVPLDWPNGHKWISPQILQEWGSKILVGHEQLCESCRSKFLEPVK